VDDGVTMVPGAWADIKPDPVWASERTAPGNERLANAENAASQVHVFRARWDPDLDDLNPKDRLVREEDGETFNILAVQKMGRRDHLEISTVARTDD
jgi:head-tail adaptor